MTPEQRRQISGEQRNQSRRSVRALRRAHPDLPRNTTAAYLRRFARLRRRWRRRALARLAWRVPGAVWAIDGTWLEFGLDVVGGRRALIVVELHSRTTIAFRAVDGERALDTVRLLSDLVERHGRPMVLKLDNGSAFISAEVRAFCDANDVALMHSPVRRPSYNGTCEVSARWAKHRVALSARARGVAVLSQDDLDNAVTCADPLPTVDPDTRAAFGRALADHRAAVRREHGIAPGAEPADHQRRALDRVAVRRAMVECHILSVEGRRYRWCLPPPDR